MEKKLLITGFDPFGGEKINPSWEAVKLLPEKIGGYTLYKMEIPTVFSVAARQVLEQAQKLQPDAILCIGQAGGRGAVTPERVAINLRDASICDNAGGKPQEQPIMEGGPAAYFSTVPCKKMVEAMKQAGFPAAVSNTAGTFVCNDVLYSVLHHFADTSVQAGFIHVPYLPSQGTPNMELTDIVKALSAAIEALTAEE